MESKKSSVIPTILAIIIGIAIIVIGYKIQLLAESEYMYTPNVSFSNLAIDHDDAIGLNVYAIKTTLDNTNVGIETAINAINKSSIIIYYCTGWIIIAIGLAVIAIAISKR